MFEWFASQGAVYQAFLATCFTWFIEELIPESQLGKHTDIATTGTLLGFTVMMVLDVALG